MKQESVYSFTKEKLGHREITIKLTRSHMAMVNQGFKVRESDNKDLFCKPTWLLLPMLDKESLLQIPGLGQTDI